jgi:hypothetical protein
VYKYTVVWAEGQRFCARIPGSYQEINQKNSKKDKEK